MSRRKKGYTPPKQKILCSARIKQQVPDAQIELDDGTLQPLFEWHQCTNPVYKKGFCQICYHRWKAMKQDRHLRLQQMMAEQPPAQEFQITTDIHLPPTLRADDVEDQSRGSEGPGDEPSPLHLDQDQPDRGD